MPELPEVEVIKEGIKPHCLHQKILKVTLHSIRLRYPIPQNLPELLQEQIIRNIERRGKYLLLTLDTGYLLLHLGMTGAFISQQNELYKKLPYEHMTIVLNNRITLSFCDMRKFGMILWIEDLRENSLLNTLGVEPLDSEFCEQYLHNKTKNSRIKIKALLMNSHFVTGIGNIYASEILYLSKIKPDRISNTLSTVECRQICSITKTVLTKAIETGGTTIRDFKNHHGKSGYFQQELAVYGRTGKNCYKCETLIQQITIGNRSTFFCPTCQS